jgi:hypothetical protein
VWTARKRDRAATGDLLRMNNADKSAGQFNKNLLADCEELAVIQKFAANARTMHYSSTMPWSDSGLRLLPTAKYFDYHKAMTTMQAEFYRLVDVFLDAYDFEVAQVHAKLGDLFNRDEYPTSDSIRSKFRFGLSYVPVPDVGDWRVDMGSEATEVLRSEYAAFYQQQTERAMNDVLARVYDHLNRLTRQLGVDEDGKKGKIFDSTIDNLRDMVEMLEHANFSNDPNIALAQQKLQRTLAGLCRDDLVKNEIFREDTRASLQDAMRSLPSLDWE